MTHLVKGGFYWILPYFDVDAGNDEDWTNEIQPARYAGQDDEGCDLWQFIDGGNETNRGEPWGEIPA